MDFNIFLSVIVHIYDTYILFESQIIIIKKMHVKNVKQKPIFNNCNKNYIFADNAIIFIKTE